MVQSKWIPTSVSADDKLNRQPIYEFLNSHDTLFEPWPVRRHNKIIQVERKHRTLKAILARAAKNTSNPNNLILSRATFLSIYFSGTLILSSFELSGGYTTSILGTIPRHVSPELLSRHKEQVAFRALHRLLCARPPSVGHPSSIK